MKLKITTSAAILGAVATTASAGSLERNNMPIELLFDSGNVVQFSYTAPNLNLSAAPFGSTGSVLNDFTTVGLAFKTDINDDLALGVFFNQPFGADNGYEGPGAAGLAIDFQSNELAAVLSYQMNQNLSLHGGVRVVESELNLSIPIPSPSFLYTLDAKSDRGFGYLLGASYVVPERGARVTLTYQSSVKHNFESTEFVGATIDGNTEAELPQSLKLDGEIALNSSTLLFGSVKWSDYSNFDVAAPGYAGIAGQVSVIDYNEDNINVSVGLGRSINDEWSGFGILEAQLTDGEANELRPYDGSRALTLGARYTSGQYEITAGAQYRQFGDATVSGATFSGNDAVSPFLQIAYSF